MPKTESQLQPTREKGMQNDSDRKRAQANHFDQNFLGSNFHEYRTRFHVDNRRVPR